MRVVAGSLGGRTFESPKSFLTHPMGEKVRGALFSMLGDIEGLSVFDPYSGSGALSIEAASRGASHVMAIDIDKDAIKVILKNVEALGIEDTVTVLQGNAPSWAGRNKDKLFDVVLLDPPYNEIRPDMLRKLAALTKPGGVVVLSLARIVTEELLKEGFERLTSKNYAGATLVIYRKIS